MPNTIVVLKNIPNTVMVIGIFFLMPTTVLCDRGYPFLKEMNGVAISIIVIMYPSIQMILVH